MAGFDLDAWLDEGTVNSAETRICLRGDLLARHAQAEIELAGAKPRDRQRMAKRVAEVEAEIEAATKTFRFEAVTPKEWADLRRAHLPTRGQLAEQPDLDHNPDTFPVAAIAASCADPVLSVADVDKIHRSRKVDSGEWQKLWSACIEANLEVAMPPKSLLATAVLGRNGGSSTTAAREGSPDPSS